MMLHGGYFKSAELGIVILVENAPVLSVVSVAIDMVSKVMETPSLLPNAPPLTVTEIEGCP